MESPLFHEASHCAICSCSFSTFKRRHHCRACGRSLCAEHSSNQMALPNFGLYSPVRVCDECYNMIKSPAPKIGTKGLDVAIIEDTEASISKLDLHFHSTLDAENENILVEEKSPKFVKHVPTFECTCGMPLCICKVPEPTEVLVVQAATSSAPLRAKKSVQTPTSMSAGYKQPGNSTAGNNMPSLFFTSTPTSSGSGLAISKSYDISGEGLREAIKNKDSSAVKNLLMQGVDANYQDRQGMSLLHLATVFNTTEIAFMLMDAGANVNARNAQGETPLDCAQPTLQHKMRQKLEVLTGQLQSV